MVRVALVAGWCHRTGDSPRTVTPLHSFHLCEDTRNSATALTEIFLRYCIKKENPTAQINQSVIPKPLPIQIFTESSKAAAFSAGSEL